MKSRHSLPVLAAAVILMASANVASAVDYYLQADMTSTPNQTLTTSGLWFDQASGGSAVATPVYANGVFHTNGFVSRTGTASFTFGDSSTILNLSGSLGIRTVTADATTIANVVSSGTAARLANGSGNNVANISVTNYNNAAQTELSSSSSGRTLNLSIGTLSGAGNLSLTGGGTILLSATTATAFTGNIYWGNTVTTVLDFNSTFVSGGSLTALSTSRINLDQNVTFASVTIAGTTLGVGTYTFAELNAYNAAFANVFNEGGSGSITVAAIPEPSTYAALAGVFALAGVVSRRRAGVRSR